MTRSNFRRLACSGVVLACLALAPAARAEDAAGARAAAGEAQDSPAPGEVVASVTRGADGLEVEGRFRVAAPQAVAWAVLTDYDAIDRFVSSMNSSHVSSRTDHEVLVQQEATGSLLFFKRRIRTTLEVHEEPPGLIRFQDVLLKDFERYQGEWRIEDRGHDVEVDYHVTARPVAAMPGFIVRGMFERTVHQLLSELQKEITNRAALAERHSTERSRP